MTLPARPLAMIAALAAATAVAGCGSFPTSTSLEPDAELPFVRGYRGVEDNCALTGESAFTNQFLSDAADLVSCPIGSAAEESLVAETGARRVGATEAYALYSVPRR